MSEVTPPITLSDQEARDAFFAGYDAGKEKGREEMIPLLQEARAWVQDATLRRRITDAGVPPRLRRPEPTTPSAPEAM